MKLKLRGILYIFIGVIWLAFSVPSSAFVVMKYFNDETPTFSYMVIGIVFLLTVGIFIIFPLLYLMSDYVYRELKQ